jgi:redox-sensing transcriptional repressor
MDILGLNEVRHVLWMGAQRLREHLSMLSRLNEHNCRIVAVMDRDPNEVGRKLSDMQVLGMDSLPQVLNNLAIDTAVIALPGSEAQKAATMLANGGVKAILNLSSTLVVVPETVKLRNMDVASELLELSYYCSDAEKQPAETEDPSKKN